MQWNEVGSKSAWTRRFGLIAAVLVAALLVGSLIAFLNITRGQHSNVSSHNTVHDTKQPNIQVKIAAGLYVGYNGSLVKNDPKTGRIIWRYNLKSATTGNGAGRGGVYKIIPIGNTVFVLVSSHIDGAHEQSVVALNAQDGSVFWQKSPTNLALQDMVVGDGTIYVSAIVSRTPDTSVIYAFDARKGTAKKSYPLDLANITMTWNTGKLYLGTDKGLTVLNAQDGKVVWQDLVSNADQFHATRPYIVNGVVYSAFNNTSELQGMSRSYLVAYNSQSGKKLWQTNELPDQLYDLTVSGQELYFGLMHSIGGDGSAFGGTIYAYNTHTGKADWNTEVDGEVSVAPTVVNGVIYVPTYGGRTGKSCTITALNASTGNIQWKKPLIFGLAVNPVVMNDLVYAATTAGFSNASKVYAYKLDGTQAWETKTNSAVMSIAVEP